MGNRAGRNVAKSVKELDRGEGRLCRDFSSGGLGGLGGLGGGERAGRPRGGRSILTTTNLFLIGMGVGEFGRFKRNLNENIGKQISFNLGT